MEERLARIFRKKPIIVAHRGYPLKYGENTLESFLAAKDLGADMVEIDVRLSADDVLVASHDPEFRGVVVKGARYRDLRMLGIEAVEDIIEALPADTLYMLDIKDEDAVPILKTLIERRGLEDRVVLAGLPRAVETLGKNLSLVMAPSFELCDWRETLERVIDMEAHILNDHYSCYDEEVHRDAAARGIRISTWTVNDPADIERMIAQGVDAIVTDNLEEALRIAGRAMRWEINRY